jgi:hypothetical protein
MRARAKGGKIVNREELGIGELGSAEFIYIALGRDQVEG